MRFPRKAQIACVRSCAQARVGGGGRAGGNRTFVRPGKCGCWVRAHRRHHRSSCHDDDDGQAASAANDEASASFPHQSARATSWLAWCSPWSASRPLRVCVPVYPHMQITLPAARSLSSERHADRAQTRARARAARHLHTII